MDRDSKKGVISKMWGRCKSSITKSQPRRIAAENDDDQTMVAPMGCFPIYVGPEKERFVIRTKQVNHPLFKNLLEEAESEYGYGNSGPLMLPCQVDHFIQVLVEMDYNFVARRSYISSRHSLSPPRFITALA